ncbi:ubiquitin-conjugating enzyme E2 C isoform X1 [Nematostella vectensis]|uniref:ubiquitin-conjugating enzyme E2 C isoform X1 n=1 Tax=Nematostella vectensis TaxID=45351 RepID=UPI00207779F7|nr:ubiquitin-conjugating enzyme E2 C isoform X1 [Nematostella vectensis]
MSILKRLNQDLMDLMMTNEKTVSAFPINDTMVEWNATITGVKDTLYDGLKYKLTISFPKEYPYQAPKVKFTTPCFHPNVDQQGNICLDILKEKWAPSYNVRTLLLSIQSLLEDPNLESPLNAQAAELWLRPQDYKRTLDEKYEKEVLMPGK